MNEGQLADVVRPLHGCDFFMVSSWCTDNVEQISHLIDLIYNVFIRICSEYNVYHAYSMISEYTMCIARLIRSCEEAQNWDLYLRHYISLRSPGCVLDTLPCLLTAYCYVTLSRDEFHYLSSLNILKTARRFIHEHEILRKRVSEEITRKYLKARALDALEQITRTCHGVKLMNALIHTIESTVNSIICCFSDTDVSEFNLTFPYYICALNETSSDTYTDSISYAANVRDSYIFFKWIDDHYVSNECADVIYPVLFNSEMHIDKTFKCVDIVQIIRLIHI